MFTVARRSAGWQYNYRFYAKKQPQYTQCIWYTNTYRLKTLKYSITKLKHYCGIYGIYNFVDDITIGLLSDTICSGQLRHFGHVCCADCVKLHLRDKRTETHPFVRLSVVSVRGVHPIRGTKRDAS